MQERDKNVHIISMEKSQRIFTSLLGKHPFLELRKEPLPIFYGGRKESDESNEE